MKRKGWLKLVGVLGGIAGLGIVLAVTGCGKKATKTIGVSLLTKQHEFYQDLQKGLEQGAQKYGYKLVVVSGEFDPSVQANQIDDFIVKKVDAIVVCPCDSRGVGASIAEANKVNIPVFTADIASISDQGKVVSHIASDNVEGGRQAGHLMVKALNGKGKVAIINHPTVTSVLDRVKGFREIIGQNPGIKIVADVPAEGQRAKAMSVMEDLLQRNPDLKGVFGINDDSALGALAAIESAGKVGKIVVVGYDATQEAKKAIADDKMVGDAIQYPQEIGLLTIDTINQYFTTGKAEAVVPVKVGTWTKEDSK